ncbi:MAG: LysR family transcriptional regulator [Chloroflexi bacterium]|nr:LysR family transcriptional regulator [Chloroflexota bacterium]
MEPRLKVWVERDGEIVLSDWRIELLEQIDRTGSLSRAAEALGVPYRTAWHKLKQIEQRLGVRLVTSHSGGSDGGHTALTPSARLLIERYHQFTVGLQQDIDQRFALVFADIVASDTGALAVPEEG